MSDSNSSADPTTTTTSEVYQTDRRAAVGGNGIVATEGAQLMLTQTDTSPEAIAAAVNAQMATADTAIRANSAVTQSALDAQTEAARLALSSNTQVSQSAIAATADTADTAIRAATAMNDSNNALTEKTREGNQELVKLVADKLSTAVADERQNINAQVIDSVTRAATIGGIAIVGAGLVYAIVSSKRKAA